MKLSVKDPVRRVSWWALVLLGLGVLGGLVAVSGVVPVAASSGHFAVTKWLLKFGMKRSVATHSLGIEAPPLDDERLVLLGAGHYESGCRFCHGAPGISPSVVAASATPAPPRLDNAASEYDASELFYIVRHGVKFTGMPAWPAQNRDDEVWAIVAFLEAWPTLDRRKYTGLVYGSSRGQRMEGAPATWSACMRCHGTRGQGRGQSFPYLATQNAQYLEATLRAYASGKRPSAIMQQVADLTETDRKELVQWLSEQPAPSPKGSFSDSDPLLETGRALARDGVPERNVPSCEDCHGPDRSIRASYPLLSGQPPSYLEQQLRLFAAGTRGGTAFVQVMHNARAHALEPAERKAVSAYYSTLEPRP